MKNKKMKSYPQTVFVEDLEALYRRILRDKTVIFVQSYTTADWTDSRSEEFDNWTDWIHLKGGDSLPPTGNIWFDCFGSWHAYFTRNLPVGSNGVIHTLEWMRPDRELHVIQVIG